MKTYNEIVDDLEVLEKEVPVKIENASASTLAEAKLYTDTKFSAGMKRVIVETLPVEDIDSNAIYMVLDSSSQQVGNVYNEYMYINSNWELIGTTATASVELYQHCIYFMFSGFECCGFVTSISPTPFTRETLAQYLVDKGFNSTYNRKIYPLSGSYVVNSKIYPVSGCYALNGSTNIQIVYNIESDNLQTANFTGNEYFYDNVIQIQ